MEILLKDGERVSPETKLEGVSYQSALSFLEERKELIAQAEARRIREKGRSPRCLPPEVAAEALIQRFKETGRLQEALDFARTLG